MTVRPPKGVRSAGNLAGRVGRSQKERVGVVPIQGRHQGINYRDGLQRGGEGEMAERTAKKAPVKPHGGRGRKLWVCGCLVPG